MQYPLQSWPTYLDADTAQAVGELTVRLARLLREAPVRMFDGDVDRLAEFYGLQPRQAGLVAELLRRPDACDVMVSRGDFIEAADGLSCVEWNFTSNLGGWRNAAWAEMYQRVPLLSEFVRRQGLQARCVDTVRQLFRHLLSAWRRHRGDPGEEHNVAFLVPRTNRGHTAWLEGAAAVYREALAEVAPLTRGELLWGSYEDLEERADRVLLHGRVVQTAVELYEGKVPRCLLSASVAGTLLLINGPVSEVLGDKGNLALLSEQAESGLLDVDERRLLASHLPWTRLVVDGYTTWRGEREYLPDLLRARPAAFVLKPRCGGRGRDVTLGRAAGAGEWESSVEKALDGNAWVVQELVEALPRPLQCGEDDVLPHDVVWGLFAFGEIYGGGFLRMMPSGRGGVINAARGASESVIFEAVAA